MCGSRKFSYSPHRKDRKFLEAGFLKSQKRVLFYGCNICSFVLYSKYPRKWIGGLLKSLSRGRVGCHGDDKTSVHVCNPALNGTKNNLHLTQCEFHNCSSTDYKYSSIVDL